MKCALLSSILLPIVAGLVLPGPEKHDYDGYRVLRIKTEHELAQVREKLSSLSFEQWNLNTRKYIDISISPEQLAAFEALGLDFKVMHENLGRSLTEESHVKSKYKRDINDEAWFDSYHPYADHVQYFDDLQAAFPDNSEIISTGKSYEGRDMFALHLYGAGGPGKPAVLYHGTVHAREWITAMTIEYITLQLINGYGTEGIENTTALLDSYDFYIQPFVNPDGFVYTQEVQRLWRKNRMPPPPLPQNQSCFGLDVNRNWPLEWDSNPEGASPEACSQVYKGEYPSSSPENQNLVGLVNKLRDSSGIKLYIDWHSYGQYILSPWGYDCTLYAENLGQHTKLAALTGDAIRTGDNGTTFTFGPSCPTLYATTGSSVDYIYGAGKAKYAFTIEGRDTGDYGFVLPPAQIRGAVKEQWVGQQTMLSLLEEEFFDGEGPALVED